MSLQGFDVLYANATTEDFLASPQQTSLFDFKVETPQTQAQPANKKNEKADFSTSVSLFPKKSSQQLTAFSPQAQTTIPSPKMKRSSEITQSRTIVSKPTPQITPQNLATPQIAVQMLSPETIVSQNLSNLLQTGTEKFKSWLGEIKLFAGIFLAVLVIFYFFTNAQLIAVLLQDAFGSVKAESLPALVNQGIHNSAPLKPQKAVLNLEEKINTLNFSQGQDVSVSMQEFLKQKEESQTFDFNLLPPTNRLIIPDLNLNVPLIDSEVDASIDVSEHAFDQELEKGVVKYPTTPTPGNKGNTLLFGHSSTEWWKKNEYGFVFRHLPKLKVGQRFQVIWNGQLTTYEMVERKVVLPKNVVEYYNLFAEKNESYLTLMGCYPIGTADKRMMVVAKKVEN